MELQFLGGAGEIGRSAVPVDDSLLLDFGMLAGNPPQFPVEVPTPDADVVVRESTYSDVDHGDRTAVEERFAESVKTTLWEGGTVVVPAFAIGRTQEMLLICGEYDIPCYVDGMGKRVTEMLRGYPAFVRDAEALRRAKSHARFVTGQDGQRKRIAETNAAIITTSGMLGNEDPVAVAS